MTIDPNTDISDLRAFNRTYTRWLGLLNSNLDSSSFSLSEARILYELVNRTDPTAAAIARELDLDPAQVSRTLKRFMQRGLITTRDNMAHGRQQLISLTDEGREIFDTLESGTIMKVGALLDALPYLRRRRLIAAANDIRDIFEPQTPPTLVLRDLRPGDLGLITYRQAILYAQEYGWDQSYEALVARIMADFHQNFDPVKDAAWVAEIDARMVGSIFLVHSDLPSIGKLRLLYVEPDARRAGVGQQLVAACVDRARAIGYARLDLWTNSLLTAARHIYEKAGFKLVDEALDETFGKGLVAQTWSMML